MYQPTDAPQSIGGVLDDGFRLYRASLPQVFLLVAVGVLAGQIPGLMVQSSGTVPSLSMSLLLSVLLSMLVSVLFYGAAIGRMHAVARQQAMSLGDALSFGARRMLPLLAFSLLYGVIIAVGLLLLIVPGVLFGVSLMFGAYVVLLDGKGPVASLAISHNLVWGSWWRTLVIVSVGSVIMMAGYLLVGFAAGFAVAYGGEPGVLLTLIEFGLLPLLGALVGPLFYALMLATYYDLKLRRSGADLEQRLGTPAQA